MIRLANAILNDYSDVNVEVGGEGGGGRRGADVNVEVKFL